MGNSWADKLADEAMHELINEQGEKLPRGPHQGGQIQNQQGRQNLREHEQRRLCYFGGFRGERALDEFRRTQLRPMDRKMTNL